VAWPEPELPDGAAAGVLRLPDLPLPDVPDDFPDCALPDVPDDFPDCALPAAACEDEDEAAAAPGRA
jgi:hypothetical protein